MNQIDNKGKTRMAKNKGGRPKAIVNYTLLAKCCKIHCTGEECAALLNIDYDTLDSNIKGKYGYGFSEYFKKKSAPGKKSLRRKQFQVADKGNVTMLIWLGKQYLGQQDQKPDDYDNNPTIDEKYL